MPMLIGEKTIAQVGARVQALLREYLSDINRVYDNEGGIKIALPLDIKFEQSKNRVKLGIKFVTDKIEDESIMWADEQGDLFDQEPKRICPVTRKEADVKVCDKVCQRRHGESTVCNCPVWVDSDIRENLMEIIKPKAKVYPLKTAAA